MSRVSRFALSAVFAVTILFHASVALSAPSGWQSVDVTLQSDQQQAMLLVAGEMPVSAKLPYQGELAVPAGTQLQWIGELLGGDPSADPEIKYTKTAENGLDVYRFTLTRARMVQIEGLVPSATSFDGAKYSTAFAWTPSQDVPQLRISQRIAQGSQIASTSAGASLQPGGSGNSYYTKTVTDVKAGEPVELAFSYTAPAAGAAAGGATPSRSGSGTTPVALLVLGFSAALLVLGFGVNRKMAAKRQESAETVGRVSEREQTEADAPFEVEGEEAVPARRKAACSAPDPATQDKPASGRMLVPIVAVVGALVLGFAIAGARGTSATVVDGKLSRNFGSTSACQSSSIALIPNKGVDLAEKGDKILSSFDGMAGVGNVTIDVAASRIDIGWCESSQTEQTIRDAVASSGLVALGAASTISADATTPVAPTGAQ